MLKKQHTGFHTKGEGGALGFFPSQNTVMTAAPRSNPRVPKFQKLPGGTYPHTPTSSVPRILFHI